MKSSVFSQTGISSTGSSGLVALAVAVGLFLLAGFSAPAQPAGFNYDEAKVPEYDLPDPLILENGEEVPDRDTWVRKRRPEILRLFEEQIYGRAPAQSGQVTFQVVEEADDALGGIATRKQVRIRVAHGGKAREWDLLVYLPADRSGPVPTFVGLNFGGNHTIQSDPGIRLSEQWMRDRPEQGVVDNKATEASRGKSSSRWPVPMILGRGYGVATMYCGDIDPDFDDGFQNGIHPLFYREGQTRPGDDEWGTIAAWAWGLSRALDYFETDADVDHRRVAVLGHSRLGKTSLWAGAQDPRFALVISNDSGCGGAALNRRRFGETVARINSVFPHWFCGNFKQYNDAEQDLPMDQHQLIALMAPRPVYIASAEGDPWADPRGEFLSGLHAGPVYRLFGKEGVGVTEWPAVDHPVGDVIGYHLRTGKHDVKAYDWEQFMTFADRHLGRANP